MQWLRDGLLTLIGGGLAGIFAGYTAIFFNNKQRKKQKRVDEVRPMLAKAVDYLKTYLAVGLTINEKYSHLVEGDKKFWDEFYDYQFKVDADAEAKKLFKKILLINWKIFRKVEIVKNLADSGFQNTPSYDENSQAVCDYQDGNNKIMNEIKEVEIEISKLK